MFSTYGLLDLKSGKAAKKQSNGSKANALISMSLLYNIHQKFIIKIVTHLNTMLASSLLKESAHQKQVLKSPPVHETPTQKKRCGNNRADVTPKHRLLVGRLVVFGGQNGRMVGEGGFRGSEGTRFS